MLRTLLATAVIAVLLAPTVAASQPAPAGDSPEPVPGTLLGAGTGAVAGISAPPRAQAHAPNDPQTGVGTSGDADGVLLVPNDGSGEDQEIVDVRMFITGNTAGVSSWVTRNDHEVLVSDALAGSFPSVSSGYAGVGAATDGNVFLFALNGFGTTALEEFVASPPFTRTVKRENAGALINSGGIVLQPESSLDQVTDTLVTVSRQATDPTLALKPTNGRLVVWRNSADAQVYGIELGEPMQQLPADVNYWELTTLDVWSVQTKGDGAVPVVNVDLLWGEGSRRLALIASEVARAEAAGLETIVVDAGNAIDGYSYLRAQTTSLHQPTDWEALRAAGYQVISPALNELVGGVEELQAQAKLADITLVSANIIDSRTGRRAFSGYKVLDRNGQRILLTGVTSPSITNQLPAHVSDRLEFQDPVRALEAIHTEVLAELEDPPDAVILLTVAEPSSLGSLQSELEGVDIVVGGYGGPRYVDFELDVELDKVPNESGVRLPLLVAPGARTQFGVLDVELSDPEPSFELVQRTVHPFLPRDERWTRQVMDVRHEVYSDTRQVLVPAVGALAQGSRGVAQVLADSPEFEANTIEDVQAQLEQRPGRLSQNLWMLLTANLLRAELQADVAVLRQMKFPAPPAGPLRQLDVMRLLAVPDQVVLYTLDGATLEKLVQAPTEPGLRPTFSGYDPESGKVKGRDIRYDRTYRVVTTDQLAEREPFESILGSLKSERLFEWDDGEWEAEDDDDDGEKIALLTVILNGLESRSTETDDMWVGTIRALAVPQGKLLEPEWSFWMRDLSLAVSQYTNVGDVAPYSDVRVTRANSNNSLRFAGKLDMSFIRDSSAVAWETRFTTAYGIVQTPDETEETDDDIISQSELRINAWSLTGTEASVPIVPYFNLLHDTEWTIPSDRDKRQNELRSTVGLTAQIGGLVDEVRSGFFGEVDFARERKPLEWGAELAAYFKADLPASLKFSADLVTRYYIPNDGDTEEDLGLTISAIVRLGVPIVERLRFDMYADAFIFRGKVAATDHFASSIIFGAAIAWDQLFVF